jgi:hypothetical protein
MFPAIHPALMVPPSFGLPDIINDFLLPYPTGNRPFAELQTRLIEGLQRLNHPGLNIDELCSQFGGWIQAARYLRERTPTPALEESAKYVELYRDAGLHWIPSDPILPSHGTALL